MATEAPVKPKKAAALKKASTPSKSETEAQTNEELEALANANNGDGEGNDDDHSEEMDEALEVLEPLTEPRRWLIGKPPEAGGSEDDDYSIYIQRPLTYHNRLLFFSLVSRTMAKAVKEGGSIDFGGGDALDAGEEITLAQRVRRLRETDFSSAGNFLVMALNLVGYSPSFLTECYILWLDVPSSEKRWFRQVATRDYAPDRDEYGISEDMSLEMIEIFVDQNYEDIRGFFAEKLPRIARRAQQQEDRIQGLASASGLSKQ